MTWDYNSFSYIKSWNVYISKRKKNTRVRRISYLTYFHFSLYNFFNSLLKIKLFEYWLNDSFSEKSSKNVFVHQSHSYGCISFGCGLIEETASKIHKNMSAFLLLILRRLIWNLRYACYCIIWEATTQTRLYICNKKCLFLVWGYRVSR